MRYFKYHALAVAVTVLSGCSVLETGYVSHRESYQYTHIDEQEPQGPEVYVPASSDTYSPESYNQSMPTAGTYFPSSSDALAESIDPNNPVEDAGASDQQPEQQVITQPEIAVNGGQELLDKALEAEKNDELGSMVMLLEESSRQGNGQAFYLLAKHYTKGDVVPKNTDMADIYLKQADALGYSEATRVMAWKSLLSHQTDGQFAEGIGLMQRAANTSIRAKRDMGMLYGNFYQPHLNDMKLSQAYLQQAYEGGDGEGAYFLHKLLLVTRADDPTADSALEYAASAGQPKALLELGKQKLLKGDKAGAKAALSAAANAGDAEAMYTFANAINIGQIPSADRDRESYLWFKLAADAKYQRANEELKALDGVRQQDEKHNGGGLAKLIEQQRGQIVAWNPNKDA